MRFRKGDRVRVIATMYGGAALQIGAVGTILKVLPHCNLVSIDDYNDGFYNSWSFNDRELEYIPTVPVKRLSEVALEKLIEAKRELQEADRAYNAAHNRFAAASKAVNVMNAQLQSTIAKEIAS